MNKLKKPNRYRTSFLIVFTIMLVFMTLQVTAENCERPARIRYSMVPEGDVKNDLADIQPLLDDLQSSLGTPVDIIRPSSYGAVIEGLLAGSIDIARLGPSSYLSAKNSNPGITAFATFSQPEGAFQKEGAFYYSLLIVNSKGRLKKHEDLRGATLVLVDPDSTSGAKVPRQLFSQVAGGSLERYFGRISYAGNHISAAKAVLEGRADAAFVSSFQLSTMVREGKATGNNFRVLWRSVPLPLDPFVYRGILCQDVREKIRSAFLGRGGKNSASILNNMNAIRFLPIQDSDYQVIKNLQ